MSAPDPAQGAPEGVLAPATLGAIHALRNSLQVIRAYSSRIAPAEPAREALASSLARILEILEVLEILAGGAAGNDPRPAELARALRLLPELFVHALRERGLQLDTGKVDLPSDALVHQQLIPLACLLLMELLEACPAGLEGRLALEVHGQELRLEWLPIPGALPFPLPEDALAPALTERARTLGLELSPIPGGLGICLAPARTGCQAGPF